MQYCDDKASLQFHLVPDRIGDGPSKRPVSGRKEPLVVPGGVSRLRVPARGEIGWSITESKGRSPRFLFEPSLDVRPPCLAVLSPPGTDPRTNGLRVARLAILYVGDQFQPRPDVILHVALFRSPSVGPPIAGWIGRRCPICLTEFTSTSQVYCCDQCGAAMHFESPEGPDELRLECATDGMACGSCRARISLAEESTYFPECYDV